MGLNTTLKLKTQPTRVMLSQTYLLMETTKVQQVGSYTLYTGMVVDKKVTSKKKSINICMLIKVS